MLEQYYVRPVTVDRIRTSWIASAIEQYVGWLTAQRYSPKSVSRRIPLLVAFGEQSYRLSGIPRSIPWEQVEQVLAGIDRRSVVGKRDYAMLLLLATYGLRACEVAALLLDDIDWRNERLKIRERKAGNRTTYPLSAVVGAAIIDYLKNGRPTTKDRHVFLRTCAPLVPIGSAAVTCRAAHYIRHAGIQVPRPGSHTLRHSCVQRLVNANFSLKHIGDYVGHRDPASTQIYGKVAVEQLREVAQGDGEEVL